MRIGTAVAVAFLTTPALAAQNDPATPREFALFDACLEMGVFVGGEPDQGVTTERVRDLAESRLRAARLYLSSPVPGSSYLLIGVGFVGDAYLIELQFKKQLIDLTAYGDMTGYASTWVLSRFGTHGRRGDSVMQLVSEMVDNFILEYLRVNDAACRLRPLFP